MRFTILPILALAASVFAAPASVSDCDSLKSIAILPGGKLFCATKYPAHIDTVIAPVADTPKNNAKRFKEDDERIMRVLGGMPEQRQQAFCACYPASAAANQTIQVSLVLRKGYIHANNHRLLLEVIPTPREAEENWKDIGVEYTATSSDIFSTTQQII
jgi:hypothetical protein